MFVARHFEILEAVDLVAHTCVGNGAEVVDVGVLIQAAVERADAVAGFAVHELGECQIVAAGATLQLLFCLLVVAFLEVEDGEIGFGVGTALTFSFLEVVFGEGVVFLCQTEQTGVVEHVGVVGVQLACHVEVAFGLGKVAQVEGHGASVVPACPFGTVVLGCPLVVFQFGVVVVIDIGGIHQLVKGELCGVEGGLFGKFNVGLAGLRVVEGNLSTTEIGEDVTLKLRIGGSVVANHLLAFYEVLLGFNNIDNCVTVLDIALFDHDDEVYPVFTSCTGGDDHLL